MLQNELLSKGLESTDGDEEGCISGQGPLCCPRCLVSCELHQGLRFCKYITVHVQSTYQFQGSGLSGGQVVMHLSSRLQIPRCRLFEQILLGTRALYRKPNVEQGWQTSLVFKVWLGQLLLPSQGAFHVAIQYGDRHLVDCPKQKALRRYSLTCFQSYSPKGLCSPGRLAQRVGGG